MTDAVVTAAEIETHLACPQQYRFEHERPVSPRRTDRNQVRDRRRALLRRAIIAGLRVDTESADDRIAAAVEDVTRRWQSTDASYLTEEQAQYDKRAVTQSIESYLSDAGHRHGNQLVTTETTLEYERNGIRYRTTVDAVVERDGRYLAIRYVPDMTGVLQVSWYDDNVERFTDGRGFYPRQIGSFVRAAIALRGLMNEYGLHPTYDFAYRSLLDGSRPAYDAADAVRVDGEQRHFRDAYETEKRELTALIEDRAVAILRGATDPRDREWRFDEITDRSCGFCPYQDACPEYMEADLSFTDRRRTGSGDSAGRPPAGDSSVPAADGPNGEEDG